jgi:hypothetical protein
MNTKIKCIICEKELEILHYDIKNKGHHLCNNANIADFTVGYGSRFDTNNYIFGLCDDCLEIKLKKGILINNPYEVIDQTNDQFIILENKI